MLYLNVWFSNRAEPLVYALKHDANSAKMLLGEIRVATDSGDPTVGIELYNDCFAFVNCQSLIAAAIDSYDTVNMHTPRTAIGAIPGAGASKQ